MVEFTRFNADDASASIIPPGPLDDKYSRGVLGIMTGSSTYPGAAVLGVEAAVRTGVGMVRFVGPKRATELVLQRRPEVVPGTGRVQAWLIGSGMDHNNLGAKTRRAITGALAEGVPTILDGGALEFVAPGPTIITPHAGELASLLGIERSAVTRHSAIEAADRFGCVVVLKGFETFVAGGEARFVAASATPWLATAGSGDALAGIMGALVATQRNAPSLESLARVAAAASVIHGLAAQRASAGGPVTILDVAAAVPATIAELLGQLR